MKYKFQLLALLVFTAVASLLTGCASAPTTPTVDDGSGPLFEVPRHWEIVDEKDGESLYQANLRNNGGAGRMLIGRLKLKKKVDEVESYLFKLHNDLVDRIRGEIDLAPFAEERLAWANGIVGYRTKMRGELGREVVIIEGITFSDGENAYFHYGLFKDAGYQEDRLAYAEVLRSLGPIRGAKQLRNQGLEIAGGSEPASSEVGSDGAVAAADYPSPSTHLGMAAWGSTPADVEHKAGLPIRKGSNALGYRCQYLGTNDCVVIYMFEYGQLTHGGFLLEGSYEDPKDYVVRYLKLTKALAQKLGRPKQSAAIWSDQTFQNQGAKWGEALAQQHVIFGSVWEIGPTKLVHSLRKDDEGNIEHRILVSNDELRKNAQANAKP